MPKGKPWTEEQENRLRDLVLTGKDLNSIAAELKMSKGAVKVKMKRLGLEVVVPVKKSAITTTSLKLPDDLPSVEYQMLVLAAALRDLQQSNLDKTEVVRLRSIIAGVKTYKELFVDYVGYREIEEKAEAALEWLKKIDEESKNVARIKS